MTLNKESILQIPVSELPRESLEVPDWGGTISVRVMTGKYRDEYLHQCVRKTLPDGSIDMRGLPALLVAFTACDESGELIFDESDVKALQETSSQAIMRVFEVAQRLNKLRPEDVEDLAGNSESGRNASSGSG